MANQGGLFAQGQASPMGGRLPAAGQTKDVSSKTRCALLGRLQGSGFMAWVVGNEDVEARKRCSAVRDWSEGPRRDVM